MGYYITEQSQRDLEDNYSRLVLGKVLILKRFRAIIYYRPIKQYFLVTEELSTEHQRDLVKSSSIASRLVLE